MTTVNLYKYIDGSGTIVTPNKREESDSPYCYRLIAEEGKSLTDGDSITTCIDTRDVSVWREIEGECEITPEEFKMRIEAIL